MALELTSPAFVNGGDIPIDYTCNGRNVSPPIIISGISNSVSLVLILDDPDAAKEPAGSGKAFDHWLVYNIPAIDQEITENSIPNGSQLGLNSRGSTCYTGPCPPTFKHEYIFRLIELDCRLNFTHSPTKAEVETAILGHVLQDTKLVAYYEQP